jgi:hypothetical protein
VAKLVHDVLELGVDHRCRDLELQPLGKLVEKLALHMGAGQAAKLLALLVGEHLAELAEAVEAQALGEIVVGLGFAGDLYLLDGDVKGRVLPLQRVDRIVAGEAQLHFAAVARLGADQLLLEAGDQSARAELDRHFAALAAFERRSADLALEIHDDEVAVLRLVALGRVLPALVRLQEPVDLLVDLLRIGLDHQPLELEPVDVGNLDVRERLEPDPDLGVLAGLIFVVELDLGLHRRAKVLLREKLLDPVLHRAGQRIALERFAVHLADQVRRHLSGAEAGHPHLRRDSLHLLVDARVDVLRRNGQHEGALQAFALGLDGLHGHDLNILKTIRGCAR